VSALTRYERNTARLYGVAMTAFAFYVVIGLGLLVTL
jgi:hypothetical protein